VLGPMVSDWKGKRPQSYPSVPVGHARARVVAVLSAETTLARIDWVSKP
jgi:hypothetical protein